MPQIIIIEKTGFVKEQTIKEYVETDLYKKAGFKTSEGFTRHTVWKVEVNQKKYNIEVFGKIAGRANQENKYDFPPPIDNVLFFGSCILINKTETNDISNITIKEWNSIYEKLFGGFEDIGSDDSELSDEEEDDDVPLTKEGYAKDGFIVDDDDDDDEDDIEDDISEEEDEDEDDITDEDDDVCKRKSKKKTKVTTKKFSKKNAKKTMNVKAALDAAMTSHTNTRYQESFLDCTSELSEEEYFT